MRGRTPGRRTRSTGGRAPAGRVPAGRRPRRPSGGSKAAGSLAGALLEKLRFLRSPKIVIGLLALWAVYEGFLSQHSIVNLYGFKQQRNELKRELAEAETRRDDLKRRLELLDTDPFAVEKLARERMGLARKGEIIYRYDTPPPAGPGETPLAPPIVDEGEEAAQE